MHGKLSWFGINASATSLCTSSSFFFPSKWIFTRLYPLLVYDWLIIAPFLVVTVPLFMIGLRSLLIRPSFEAWYNPLYRGIFEAARVKFENNPNLMVELNKYGYPEVYYLQNGQWIRIDVSTKDGLNKLFEFSPSPLGRISDEEKKSNQKVKKRPTKGKKRK